MTDQPHFSRRSVRWIDPDELRRIMDETRAADAPTPWPVRERQPHRIVIKRGKRQPMSLRVTLGIAGLALIAQLAFLTWIGGF